jgi:hypothetical protein
MVDERRAASRWVTPRRRPSWRCVPATAPTPLIVTDYPQGAARGSGDSTPGSDFAFAPVITTATTAG